ncbi:uncharacterized protein LOC124913664 [Impatiens glandulifera]|uniref:uncharacterized protein LOC124913664 n=1 Tax=Impatiens glandulifera TaxID=253017 RepID=UPI001FB0D64F|nr:uncharacterized protein LOC124913664 [Impatiens glandulifera]
MKLIIVMTKTFEFTVEVASQEETIVQLKQKIHQLVGISPPFQTLTIYGWELMDGLDFEDYPIISDNTKIDLSIKHHKHQHVVTLPRELETITRGKMTIIIKFSSRKINIDIDNTETVRSLKEKIHIIDGTPIKRMSLFFSGRELEEDFRGLSEYGIHESSEIVVFLKTMSRLMVDPPSRGVNVVVQTSSSLLEAPARFTLEMKDTSTVSELRHVVLMRKILPMDEYIFIHKQRIMRESCSLRWHGVEDGDCLYVFKGTVSRAG